MIDARGNFEEVNLQLLAFTTKVEKVTKIVLAKISLDLFTAVVRRSPVDTGRFRWNWMLSIGEMSLEYDPTAGGRIVPGKRRKAGAGAGRAAALSTLGKLTSMELGQSVFITNNTPYGIVIEAGHSDQAPKGVVLVSVVSVVERAKSAMKIGLSF